jgi:tRNA A-37 threonylcarbamoyl transferase component Bud32
VAEGDRVRHPLPALLGARYRVGRVLGRGAMSTVYAARDELLGRDVAIKVFASGADSREELRAQEAEARLAASLSHYALTTLHDAGVDMSDPDRPQIYLVMERVDGTDLRERLRARGPLEPFEVAYLGLDLADGLAHVHEHGFVHGDIKPANVLLAERGRIRAKLTDFGISSLIEDSSTELTLTGTAAYLSPEQVEGRRSTPASDVYSLGLVLLEALTGSIAYPGDIEESAYSRLDRQPDVPASVPPLTARILRDMTDRDPARRPTPRAVADRFQDVVVDELVRRRGVDPALLPPDEAERAAAVRRYNILDTPAEDAFDRVTRITSRLLGAPVALVSVIDVDRVWHKSMVGTDIKQVDRGVSFCATTNPGTGAPWTVPDAVADPRTRNSPIVTGGPEVRAYAAAPLVTHDGHHLGSLCVYDFAPRWVTDAQLADLEDLAGIVMRELELRLASRRAVFDR